MPLAPYVEIPKLDDRGNVVIGRDGQPVKGLAINEPKNHVRPYWLVSDPLVPVLAAAGAAGDNTDLRFLVDSQGHFDWAYLVGNSTGAYTLEFFDPGTQRRLSNRPVHSANVVGSGVRPFRLPEPYFFNVGDAQRELICKIRNLTAAPNTVRLVPIGRRFYHHEAPPHVALEIARKFGEGWRTYTYFLVPNETKIDGTIDPVLAGGTATFTFEADANADTIIQKTMVSSTGPFTYRIRERATNRILSNGDIHSTNGWGTAEFPHIWTDTYLIERQKQLLVEVTDLSGHDNTIFFTMGCRRLQLV